MKIGSAAAIAVFIAVFPYAGNAADQCDAHVFGVQIDQTAQALRTLNRESERRFQERLLAIAKAKGWTESQKADKAAAAMDDSKLETFNAEIEQLVGQLDTLNVTPKNDISCARLSELKSVNDKLIAIMRQKAGFILAQLESEAGRAPISPYSPTAPMGKSAQPPQLASATPEEMSPANVPPANVPWSANVAKALRPPASAQQTKTPAASETSPPSSNAQQTKTASAAEAPLAIRPAQSQQDGKVASLRPPVSDALPPATSSPTGYTPQDIRNAGAGVFGTLTSEFAAVMNHAFDTFGQPNAYIIGDEGGGAFLAGLRYGEGTLYSRVNGVETAPSSIYWQGPSLGADIGATGSRTLFLVYNLENSEGLYRRFPGIDGSAYVAGGFGLTLYRSRNMLIVPIRTGLGLRIGASVAYLKFTERASLNPF
jgi:hypothetical protein